MKMSKKILSAAIALATISSTSAMAASYVPAVKEPNTTAITTEASTKMTVKVGTLNVRSKAMVGKNVVGSLKKGAQVDVIKQSGKWCQINFKDKDAFVACKYLK